MTVETYGPADLYVVAFPQERIPQGVRDAVLGTLSSGVITLLDLLVVRRQADGSSEVVRSRTWVTSSISRSSRPRAPA